VEPVAGEVREQANGDGVLDADEVAKAAGQDHLFEILQGIANILKQGDVAGKHGRLGPHEVVDVRLTEGDIAPPALGVGRGSQHIFAAKFPVANAGSIQIIPKAAVGVDEMRFHERCKEIDQAGPADPLGLHHVDGDDHGFIGVRVDADVFDGPAGGAHAEADPAPFEGRAGGTGGTGHPVLITDDNLAVGTDIDVQGQPGIFEDSGRENPRDDVASHKARYGTHTIDEDMRRQIEPQVARTGQGDTAGHGRVGRQPDIGGIDTVEELGHGGIGGQGQVGNVVG